MQRIMRNYSHPQTLFSAFVAVLLGVMLAATPSQAQDLGELYAQARDVAQQAQQAQQNQQHEEARDLYLDAYARILEFWEAGQEMEHEGAIEEGQRLAIRFQYRAGLMADAMEDYDSAITHFDNALEYDDQHGRSWLGKAEAYRKSDRFEEGLEYYQLAMERGSSDTVQNAENALRSNFHYLASSQLGQDENVSRTAANQALSYLEQMQEYISANSSTYYYMAVANEALGNYAEAIDLATQALDIFSGSRTDQARIHLVRGEAHMAAGNNAEAREDLEAAQVGDYAQRASALLEQL